MATFSGHVITGSRALGLVGDLTGHVMTGSGSGRAAETFFAHIVTGAGHLIGFSQYAIQEFPIAYNQADIAIRGMQDWAQRLQANTARPMLLGTNASQDLMLAPRATQRNVTLISDVESRAWDSFMENGGRGLIEQLKEMGLTLGCAASGDLEGAIEHGVKALELSSQEHQEAVRYIRDVMSERAAGRSGEGIVRDMGMIRHSGD